MRRSLVFAAAGLLSATAMLVVTASTASADGGGGGGHGNFAAGAVRMDGAQEVPGPGDTDGRGTFAYLAFDSKLCYLITARKIEPAAAAHVHSGARGVAGGIVIGLTAPTDGFEADCIEAVPDTTPNTTAVLTQSELNAIIANPAGFYANVHNATFPAGAIRGQLR
jgi:CHRD domain-containing protein